MLKEVICSYTTVLDQRIGMPIGNLTSQIFANIYLNELDSFIKHRLKVKAYVRYGDDFVVFEKDLRKLKIIKSKVTRFLENELKLEINQKSDKVLKASQGLKFLGVKIWPNGRTLNKRSLKRIKKKLNITNAASYYGLITQHCNVKHMKRFNWELMSFFG